LLRLENPSTNSKQRYKRSHDFLRGCIVAALVSMSTNRNFYVGIEHHQFLELIKTRSCEYCEAGWWILSEDGWIDETRGPPTWNCCPE